MNNTSLDFKVVQLEGRLALYESLVTEIVKLEIIEEATAEIKAKLEDVVSIWNSQVIRKSDAT